MQALFDKTINIHALDRTATIYANVEDKPEPSAARMLESLKNRQAIMTSDNRSSELHSSLVRRVSEAGGNVKLITIESGIREDKLPPTDSIQIEAV